MGIRRITMRDGFEMIEANCYVTAAYDTNAAAQLVARYEGRSPVEVIRRAVEVVEKEAASLSR